MEERLPPYSREAERSVLGSMIRDNACIADVAAALRTPEAFYPDAHQKLYQAIVGVHAEGKPVDLVTLAEDLKARRWLEDTGGYVYLAELWDAAPTAANVRHYTAIVRDKSILRALIRAGLQIAKDAYEALGERAAEETLATAERLVFALADAGNRGQAVPMSQVSLEVSLRLDARVNRYQAGSMGISGLRTGWIDLDNLTAGLQDSELIIIAARPSIGKTAFGLGLTRNVAVVQGLPVFFASLEQARTELGERLFAADASVNSMSLRKGCLSKEDLRSLSDCKIRLGVSPLFIDDASDQTMLDIASTARRLKLRNGLRLVVVDYLQLVRAEDRTIPRHEQVGMVARRLKTLAKELSIPVVALAQLNRKVEDRSGERPKLSDIRESGEVEQHADTVMLLHRNKANPDVLEVIIGKNRNGPVGEVKFSFLKHFQRFENYAADVNYQAQVSVTDDGEVWE